MKVVVSGDQELKEIRIDPELLDPEELDMLQDLIMAAVNEGAAQGQRNVSRGNGASSRGASCLTSRDFKMAVFPQPLQRLMEGLNKLPGIGSKSAQRIAFPHSPGAQGREVSALAERWWQPNRR